MTLSMVPISFKYLGPSDSLIRAFTHLLSPKLNFLFKFRDGGFATLPQQIVLPEATSGATMCSTAASRLVEDSGLRISRRFRAYGTRTPTNVHLCPASSGGLLAVARQASTRSLWGTL